MRVRLPALVVAVGAVAAMSGCDDRSPFRASIENTTRSLGVYAMNGLPSTFPAGVRVFLSDVTPIDASWQFDFAFDMDAIGVVKVYSVRAVATELSPVNRVGFRIDSVNAFDAINEAPTTGYVYDSLYTLAPQRTLLIDVFDVTCQGRSFLGINLRAKLIIDSVDVSLRKVYARMLANRNCGFRSLAEGLPKE